MINTLEAVFSLVPLLSGQQRISDPLSKYNKIMYKGGSWNTQRNLPLAFIKTHYCSYFINPCYLTMDFIATSQYLVLALN